MKATLFLVSISLALSTASGAAASLIWFSILAVGVYYVTIQLRRRLSPQSIKDPISIAGGAPSEIARIWVWICVAATLLMVIPTAYWGGPWPERHPQWRLLLAALGSYWILRYANFSYPRVEILKKTLVVATAIGLVIALLGVLLMGASDFAPTNRIPWMAAISTLACALLALSFTLPSEQQRISQLGIFCSLVTIITAVSSGVRGSWGLLFVLPILLYLLARNSSRTAFALSKRKIYVSGLSLIAILSIAAAVSPDNPLERAQTAFKELSVITNNEIKAPGVYEGSVGIRLAMYTVGLQNATESGFMGIGHDAHKALLRQLFQDLRVTGEVTKLAHYHNDILNPWVEFGLMGLAGYLIYFFGLIYIAFALRRINRAASIGFGALAVTHISTGLTNVNFAHNYYPIMLSVSIFILLMSIKDDNQITDNQRYRE